MQQQQASGLRGFVQKPLGKVFLVAITILVVFATYVYIPDGQLLAIPAMLIFGLALPIWLGLKRPRYLAITGIVVILIVAPVATLVITQEIRTPIGPASSLTTLAGTNGAALLENASVSPYTGTTATNFTWTVWLNPAGVPKGNSSPYLLELYISTCPGATSTSPPTWCSSGYPFHQLNVTSFTSAQLNGTQPVTFHYRIGSNNIWEWQLGVYTRNLTSGKSFYQNLVGDPTYNGLEGPVVGDYATTYGELIGTIFITVLLYLAAPFYLILVFYMLFKNRERRRKEAAERAAGPVPPTTPPDGGGTALPSAGGKGARSAISTPPSSSTVRERTCPQCNAVVYENETTCWKCGAALTEGRPLSTGG